MSDKNIEVIRHIRATGKCPEDAIMATSMYSESGYQPEAGKEFKPKNNLPHTSAPNKETEEDIIHEYEYNYVDVGSYANIDVDYSDSLFDPNEKDPAMRALNMVKEYCRVSLKKLQREDLDIRNKISQQRAYVDVIDFIKDHQNKCLAVKQSEALRSEEIEHTANERDWFEKRMKDYRESFFRVCDIVEHSDCADIIKTLVDEERKRY